MWKDETFKLKKFNCRFLQIDDRYFLYVHLSDPEEGAVCDCDRGWRHPGRSSADNHGDGDDGGDGDDSDVGDGEDGSTLDQR